jgi:type I site-specific restriction endonuclease
LQKDLFFRDLSSGELGSPKTDMSRKFSEEQTHKGLIDPQLEQAGWYLRAHSKVNSHAT